MISEKNAKQVMDLLRQAAAILGGTLEPEENPQPNEQYLTTAELQQRLKLSHMTIARLRKRGELKIHQFGERGVRFAMTDIKAWERLQFLKNAKTA